MTNDILPSDVDLAKALLGANHFDAEVVQALIRRGVDPFKAAHLVNDLRHGRPVNVAPPLPSFQAGLAQASTSNDTLSGESRPRPRYVTLAHRTARQANGASTFTPTNYLLRSVLLVVVCAVATGWWFRTRSSTGHDIARIVPGVESSPTAPSLPPASAGLVVLLAQDGLHIGPNLVTGRNALRAISETLGLPTRTNRIDRPNKAIYAYDRHGVLLYCGEGAGNDSIVLDCDAVGGTNGTKEAFAGSIEVDDRLIRVDTDAHALTTIEKLGLTRVASDDTATFKGHCCNLDVYFAYLRNPARLSFVEIDLKDSP